MLPPGLAHKDTQLLLEDGAGNVCAGALGTAPQQPSPGPAPLRPRVSDPVPRMRTGDMGRGAVSGVTQGHPGMRLCSRGAGRPLTGPSSCSPPWRLLARLLAGPSPPSSAGLLPPSALLRRTPSATPKPQGQHARPPAFLPCFHLGGVPQNTRLPEAAAASGPWERTWKPWLGRGLQHHQPSRWPRDESREPRRQGWAGPTSAASGVWRRGRWPRAGGGPQECGRRC